MSRITFENLLQLIQPKLQRHKPGTLQIKPPTQLLIVLCRLTTLDSLESICEKFDVGRSTASKLTRRVTDAIVDLAPLVIKWPTNEYIAEIWRGFEATSAFPKVIGAIDGTHFIIPAPRDDNEAYIDRKDHHSIQMHAICDHKCRFIHCYVGHVGSVHDQQVFRLSEIQGYLGNETKFPEDCHLVEDSAYKLHNNLLTPYRNNGHLTESQKNYNFCHASARISIERAFAFFKKRFGSLVNKVPIFRTDLITRHITACCVLHNICIDNCDEIQEEIEQQEPDDDSQDVRNAGGNTSASNKRDVICSQLRMRCV